MQRGSSRYRARFRHGIGMDTHIGIDRNTWVDGWLCVDPIPYCSVLTVAWVLCSICIEAVAILSFTQTFTSP